MKENKQLAALVRAAQGGDQSAFARLYRETRDRAYFVALSITKNEDDALDILQDAYLKAWQRLPSLEDPEQFSAWFRAITGNTAKDYLRKHSPLLFTPLNGEESGPLDWLEEQREEYLPARSMDTAETRRLILGIVQKLPEDQRLCVLMHYYEDLPVAEIAAALELPQGTVKSRLWYARQSISEGVRRLERTGGVKLYSAAPLPFVIWVLRHLKAPAARHLPRLILGSGAGTGAATAGTAAAGGAAAGGTAAGTATAGSIVAGIALPKVVAGVVALVIAGGAVTAATTLPERQDPGEAVVGAVEVVTEAGAPEAVSAAAYPFSLPPLPWPAVSETRTSAFMQQLLLDAPETRPAVPSTTAPAHTTSQAATSTVSTTTTSTAATPTATAPTKAAATVTVPATVPSVPAIAPPIVPAIVPPTVAPPLIPDPGLEAAIRAAIKKPTGALTKADLAKVTELDVTGYSVRSLEGIKNCTKMTAFICSGGTSVETADFSGMKSLDTIEINGGHIANLNVSDCSSLMDLHVFGSNLETLLVRGCTKLDRLVCIRNNLTSLDVRDCAKLRILCCQENRLTSLDVRNCTALEQIFCDSNNLTSLDVSGLAALNTLYCSVNNLTSLDVSGLAALRVLICDINYFPSPSAIAGYDSIASQLTNYCFYPQK